MRRVVEPDKTNAEDEIDFFYEYFSKKIIWDNHRFQPSSSKYRALELEIALDPSLSEDFKSRLE